MTRPERTLDAVRTSTPSKKRVNWEIDADQIVTLGVHSAMMGMKPGQIVTNLIREHLKDFSVTDQRKARETRSRNRAAAMTTDQVETEAVDR